MQLPVPLLLIFALVATAGALAEEESRLHFEDEDTMDFAPVSLIQTGAITGRSATGIVEPKVQAATSRSEWLTYCQDVVVLALIFVGVRSVYHAGSPPKALTKDPLKIHTTTATIASRHCATELATRRRCGSGANSQSAATVDLGPLMRAAGEAEGDWRGLLEALPGGATAVDAFGCTALHVAARAGNLEMTEALLDKGADPNVKEAWEETPLHFAAARGSRAVCSALLDRGAELSPLNSMDRTPLFAAAEASKEDVCEFLLDRGAHVDASDSTLPPLLTSLLFVRMMRPLEPLPEE